MQKTTNLMFSGFFMRVRPVWDGRACTTKRSPILPESRSKCGDGSREDRIIVLVLVLALAIAISYN